MMQKIVIKVPVMCDKCKCKAMETAGGADGVVSVARGNKDKIVVTGDGVDAANLTIEMVEKFGYASLEIVEELGETAGDEDTRLTPTTTHPSSCQICSRDSCPCCCTIL